MFKCFKARVYVLEVPCGLASASLSTEIEKVGAIPLLSGMLESDQERSMCFYFLVYVAIHGFGFRMSHQEFHTS